MKALLRLLGIGGLLLGAAAATPAAAQGRNDHDTPAIERKSEGRSWRYSPPCQTSEDGWVMCRDRNGYWQRDRYDPQFGDWWDGDEPRRPPPDLFIQIVPQ